MVGTSSLPPALQLAAPLFKEASLLDVARSVFATADAGGFRVYMDDACGTPADWRDHLRLSSFVINVSNARTQQAPLNSTLHGQKERIEPIMDFKYGAESFIPHQIAASPFVTSDWRRANASLVVLYAHVYGGPVFGPERCRQALAKRSEAWRATGGKRHFFVLTGDFGICDHSGHMVVPEMFRHHIIATHGEVEGHHWHWGSGPSFPCFVPQKDISIPPSNMQQRPALMKHFLGRAMSSSPSLGSATAAPTAASPVGGGSPPIFTLGSATVARPRKRTLLAFFAGAGEFRLGKRQGRQLMLRFWGYGADQSIRAVARVPRAQMLGNMSISKFCPIFGGNSPWSTRLVEIMSSGCVPVFFSAWLPPFSRILDWDRFSVRVPSLDMVPDLKSILERQPYEKLAANVPLALGAIWYRLEGGYQGDDLLAFLLLEMHLALLAAAVKPLAQLADEIVGMPLHLTHFEDDVLANRSSDGSQKALMLPPKVQTLVARAVRGFPPQYRGGITIVSNRTKRSREQVFRCVPMMENGHSYRASDPHVFRDGEPDERDTRLNGVTGWECRDMQGRSKEEPYDPVSPTQVPLNQSLVRDNREFFLNRKGRGKLPKAGRA